MTALELLVSLAIVAVLLGLLLPATLYVREKSRQMGCISNLRQIALATSSYVDQSGVYPPHALDLRPTQFPGQLDSVAWINLLAPWLETASADLPLNKLPPSQRAYLCPSDNSAAERRHGLSYVANSTGGSPFGDSVQGLIASPFTTLEAVRPAAVVDGLSQTTLASECIGWNAESVASSNRGGPGFTWQVGVKGNDGSVASIAAESELAIEDCRIGPRIPLVSATPGGADWAAGTSPLQLYSHWLPPNMPRCDTGTGQLAIIDRMEPASSVHGAFVHVAWLDGHVTRISDSIDLRAWRSMGTIAGGEPNGPIVASP